MLCMHSNSVSMIKKIWSNAACDNVGFSSFVKSYNMTRSHHIVCIFNRKAIRQKMYELYETGNVHNSWRKSLFEAVMQEKNTYSPLISFTGAIHFPNVILFVTFALFHTLLMPRSSWSAFTAACSVFKWKACNDDTLKSSSGCCSACFHCGQLNKECNM